MGFVVATLRGERLRGLFPSEQLSAESKEALKRAWAFVATMTAILLGLLISSSKGAFDTARTEVMQMAAKVALLDRVLKLYGPEAMDARHALRDASADGVRRTWPEGRSHPARLDPNEQTGDAVYAAISHLAPRDEAQRALKTQAATLMVQLAEVRALLQAQAVSSVSKPLLIALVMWLLLIFPSLSLPAPGHPMETLALLAGAFPSARSPLLNLQLDPPFFR